MTASTDRITRQQVLVLYLGTSALDSAVVGWSLYDGTGRATPTTGDSDEPPYETGVAALRDGRLTCGSSTRTTGSSARTTATSAPRRAPGSQPPNANPRFLDRTVAPGATGSTRKVLRGFSR